MNLPSQAIQAPANNDAVHATSRDRVLVLTIANPPVNGLSHRVRAALLQALQQAETDDGIDAVVLTGGNAVFSAGADVREFGTPLQASEPRLPALLSTIENLRKPVVAAIAGHCLGGGLELALACHARIAQAKALLGLPEVKLGLLPGAGGTQRLPRAVGMARALDMILSGDPMPAASLAGTQLLQDCTEGDVVEAAHAWVRQALAERHNFVRLRDLPLEPDAAATLQARRAALASGRPAREAVLAVFDVLEEGATRGFDAGLARERQAFLQLLDGAESRALRHLFAAERLAPKVVGLAPDVTLRPVQHVGVIGAGTMGGGVAIALLDAGLDVVLLESRSEALDKGLATIGRHYEERVAKNRLSSEQVAQRMARLRPTLAYDDLAEADLVIEAVFEDIAVKQQVFERLDASCKPGAILASNTSALDLDRIASFTRRPQDVIGLHFFSPAHVMRLLEVVRGAQTADDVLATTLALAKRIRKLPVVARVCDGFIGNRMFARYAAAANRLIDLGATPQQVDGALEAFGFAMGIFRVGDLAGLELAWAGRKRRAAAQPDLDFSVVADRLCEAGRFGQKTGAGWYRYEPGRRDPLPDPEVDRIVAAWREQKALQPRDVSDAEIVERCVYALVNEGARLLAEGIAQRAGDLDVVYVNGYGFPRWRGGPMKYADEIGLPKVVQALERIASESPSDAAFWTPAPLLVQLASGGQTFN